MERKTTHRILGFFVIIGIIIILLPFLQGGKEVPAEPTVIKAPPFPDQSVQINEPIQFQDNPPQDQPAIHANEPSPQANEEANIPQEDMIHTSRPSIVEAKPSENFNSTDKEPKQPESIRVIKSIALTERDDIEAGLKPASISNKKVIQVAKAKQTNKLPPMTSDENDGLIKLKGAVWVIQIGSFKDKANALRLVNQLRSKGYKAFIQEIATTLGSSTRVFVGPENKRTKARALASRLENEMNLRGIVISYKPLAL